MVPTGRRDLEGEPRGRLPGDLSEVRLDDLRNRGRGARVVVAASGVGLVDRLRLTTKDGEQPGQRPHPEHLRAGHRPRLAGFP